MPEDGFSKSMWDFFFFRKITGKIQKKRKRTGESQDKMNVTCSSCGQTFPESLIIKCYDCGKPYCRDCAGPGWIGACPDCEEVFEAEEDYWDWR